MSTSGLGSAGYGSLCYISGFTESDITALGVDSGTAASITAACGQLYPNSTYFEDVDEESETAPTNTIAKYVQEAIGAIFEALADYGATAGLTFTQQYAVYNMSCVMTGGITTNLQNVLRMGKSVLLMLNLETDAIDWYNNLGHLLCYCKEEAILRAEEFASLLSGSGTTNTGLVIPIEYKCSSYDYQVEAYCLWRFDAIFYSQSWSDTERTYAWGNYYKACLNNIENDSDLQKGLKWLVDVEAMNPNFTYESTTRSLKHNTSTM